MRRTSCFSVSCTILTGLTIIGFLWGLEVRRQVGKPEPKAMSKMVRDLANRNPPPKIVMASPPRPESLTVPLFPKNYNWEEQNRVVGILRKLRRDTTDEVWEEFVRQAENPQYSLTLIDEDENATNCSIGSFCGPMAYIRLTHAFSRHLPLNPNPTKFGRKISLDIDLGVSLVKWREQRRNKALYELQIELCEQALIQLGKLKGVPQDEIEASRKKIEVEMAELRKSKRASVVTIGGEISSCNAEQAKEIWDDHERHHK